MFPGLCVVMLALFVVLLRCLICEEEVVRKDLVCITLIGVASSLFYYICGHFRGLF